METAVALFFFQQGLDFRKFVCFEDIVVDTLLVSTLELDPFKVLFLHTENILAIFLSQQIAAEALLKHAEHQQVESTEQQNEDENKSFGQYVERG